jgi:hypothetical protein
MRTTRLTTASLATALSAVAIGMPAPALAAGSGNAADTPLPQAPTWPVDPQVIPPPPEVAADAGAGSGFDWDAAGIGAATVFGAFAMGTAGVAVVRRRRITRVRLSNH